VLEWQYDCVVTTVESESDALEYLRLIDVFPHLIIYEYVPDAFLVEDFIVYVKESQKRLQFLVLAEKIHGPSGAYFESMPTFHLVKRELLWPKAWQLIRESFKGIITEAQEPMCRIHMSALDALNGIDKDLYLKLPSGKMVHLFASGVAGAQDVEKYRAKGVQFLWLERPTCDWIVEQIQTQFHIFVANRNFQFVLRSPESSPAESFDQKIIRVCDELHLDPDFKREIELVMEKVMDVVQKDIRLGSIVKLIREQDPSVSYFAKNLQLMSIISCFLAKQMEWHSKTTLDKLVYASVMHDITLATKPHLQRIAHLSEFEEKKKELSEEEHKLFLNHPREAAQLVKTQFKFAPPETDVLVMQHHELPGAKGFPGKLDALKLSPLSQLFIVTQDFVRYVMNETEPMVDAYLLRAETRFESHLFRRFIDVLKKFRRK
jgi:response regulator RpfG family c-di-GMP phosphodiesterase